ncbi:MAG: hypothetical protein MJZ57_03805 [Bacteroidales bacterium]|nr:hypothetical protein [Bacteroidales bacterium]
MGNPRGTTISKGVGAGTGSTQEAIPNSKSSGINKLNLMDENDFKFQG